MNIIFDTLNKRQIMKVLANIFESTKILSRKYFCFAAKRILVAFTAMSRARAFAIAPALRSCNLEKRLFTYKANCWIMQWRMRKEKVIKHLYFNKFQIF